MSSPDAVTELLERWSRGDKHALDQLMAAVHSELRKRAASYGRRYRLGETLRPTALIDETYLGLLKQRRVEFQNRSHFFAIASIVMRHVILHHLRRKGKGLTVSIDEHSEFGEKLTTSEFGDLHRALEKLEAEDLRSSRVLELKYFGGLKGDEIAEVLGISRATVKRDIQFATAWLKRELSPRKP